MTTIDRLTAEYAHWLSDNGLKSMSADELLYEISTCSIDSDTAHSRQLRLWLSDFIARWDAATRPTITP